MKWLRDFHSALHTGKLEEFTGQAAETSSGFPSLPQISFADSVTLSQLSFAKPTQETLTEDKPPTPTTPTTSTPKTDTKEKSDTESAELRGTRGSAAEPIVFASPPKRRGLFRRAEKKEESRKEMMEAKRIMTCIQDRTHARRPCLSSTDWSYFEIKGELELRRFNVGQAMPVIKAIPQTEKIQQAIQAIERKDNLELLARWDDYGYATYYQLKLMSSVTTARNNFKLVQSTVDWIEKVEFKVDCVVPPFKDMLEVTKDDHKRAVEDLNLGEWHIGKHAQHGSEFLDFRENLWLRSGPIIGALFMLRETYEDVGVVNLDRWGDYGLLKLMADIVKAKNNFAFVEAAMAWMDTVEFHVGNIVHPFKDAEDVTKAARMHAVDTMKLGVWYVGRHGQYGSEFLDFPESLWLHTGSIIGGLLLLRATYEAVGIVNPRFHDFDHPDQKSRTAKGYGAGEPGIKRVISVINLGNHWGAFFVNVETTTCYLFDPKQLKSNVSTLKRAVATVVEPMLGITDQLSYEAISGCLQKDSSSCGVWCLVVLELYYLGQPPRTGETIGTIRCTTSWTICACAICTKLFRLSDT
ncbi:hypothetical protein V7S43_016431 [Phytophthora oleae]|uniref:Ubiquitin-like protease family profile domain-containing protein n=1 Tax=Phytophthora oleae TaxID=2107226 RepID=A0ABD3EVK3_9STRA